MFLKKENYLGKSASLYNHIWSVFKDDTVNSLTVRSAEHQIYESKLVGLKL